MPKQRPTGDVELGKRLRKLREAAGVPQTAIAQQVGMHGSVISGYERGFGTPSQAVLDAYHALAPAEAAPPPPTPPQPTAVLRLTGENPFGAESMRMFAVIGARTVEKELSAKLDDLRRAFPELAASGSNGHGSSPTPPQEIADPVEGLKPGMSKAQRDKLSKIAKERWEAKKAADATAATL